MYSPPLIKDDTIYFGSWDCHLYAVDIHTHKEIWRFTSSIITPAWLPPPYEAWEAVVKINATDYEEEQEERYGGDKINLLEEGSEYSIKSEYAGHSEYASESGYK